MTRRPVLDERTRLQTAGYFGGHVVLGLVAASLGPTLPALAASLSTVPASLGLLFTVRALGYLLGSILCGRLYDRRAAHPLLALAISLLAASLCLVPLMPNRAGLLAIMLVIGGGQGVLDVGNNTTLVRVHGAAVAPYMSALHCFYGVGAVASPFVIDAAGGLGWAYVSLALASLPMAAYLLLVASPPLPVPATAGSDASKYPIAVLLAFVVLFLFCQGAEAGFSGWIYVIAQQVGFGDTAAARLLSGFWATFTCGRVISILIATRVRARHILALDLIASMLGVVLMLVWSSPTGLWVGTLALGFALASVFPAALALAGEFLPLSGSVTSRIFVGSSLGALSMPWLLGHALDLGPQAPLVLILANLAGATLVLARIVTARRQAPTPAETHASSSPRRLGFRRR